MPKAEFDDVGLYYETFGKGYPLLLVAGLGSDSVSWQCVSRELSGYFKVIVFDNRGSGQSGVPAGKYSISGMAGDCIKLLDRLKIERCHVAGHSMGGYTAQELAIRYPERVNKLVLEGTSPRPSQKTISIINDLLSLREKSGDLTRWFKEWSFWLFSPETFSKGGFVETFIRNASKYPYVQSVEGFRRQIGAIAAFDASKRIKRIRAGTLVLVGEEDILITPKESRALLKNIPNSTFASIEEAGHYMHLEDPKKFVDVVAGFLSTAD